MDFKFQVDFVPVNYVAQAMRSCVLWQVIGRSMNKGDQGVINGVNRLLGIWRCRLLKLHEVGWSATEGKNLQYLRNCEPFIASMKPIRDRRHANICHRSHICPWCWCREVIGRVDVLLRAGLHRMNMDWCKGRRDYQWKIRYSTVHKQVSRHDHSIHQVFADEEIFIGEESKKMVRLDGSVGSIFITTVEPFKEDWVSSTRIISLIPFGQEVYPIDYYATDKVAYSPAAEHLTTIFRATCIYPVGMMYGDPLATQQILEEHRHHRLLRRFGCFNQRTKRFDTWRPAPMLWEHRTSTYQGE